MEVILDFLRLIHRIVYGLRSGDPVGRGGHVLGNSLACTRQRHRFESSRLRANAPVHGWLHACLYLVPAQFSRIEKLWLVDEIVVEHRVHTFGWNLVISELDILGLVHIVVRLEAAKVLHDDLSFGLLLSGVLVVVPVELRLPWLIDGVWLVSV